MYISDARLTSSIPSLLALCNADHIIMSTSFSLVMLVHSFFFLYFSGPFVSVIMVDQFGYRTPAILGGLLAALGLFLASFANGIIMLLISIGFITGKGTFQGTFQQH